jgi:hypothetical protein
MKTTNIFKKYLIKHQNNLTDFALPLHTKQGNTILVCLFFFYFNPCVSSHFHFELVTDNQFDSKVEFYMNYKHALI